MNNIRLAEEKDILYIKKLVDENISADYFSSDFIKNIINEKDSFLYVFTDEEIPVAMIYCTIKSLEEACALSHIPLTDSEICNYDRNDKVLLYKTTCTDDRYRQNGILNQFMDEVICATKGLDYKFSIVLALELPDGIIPADKALVRSGFIRKSKVITPWINIKSYCNYCDNEYCRCNGVMYIRRRD